MRLKCRVAPLICLLALAAAAPAEEGLWLFEAPPRIKAPYGFELTQPWLDHLRLSSVRFDQDGSASFVSASGLVLTNHHLAAKCLHQVSTSKRDYFKNGYYARAASQEQKCPDMEFDVVEGISDVTQKVSAALKSGMTDAAAAAARRATVAAIEKDCSASLDVRCDVVTLYAGELFHLYKYRRYTDIRLLFAPEAEAAFFGGDAENFEYPRYDLDIAFFRVYENDQPLHSPEYLRWSAKGAQEGEAVFVSGDPGLTERRDTVNQLEFLSTLEYPFRLKDYRRRIAVLENFAARSRENARVAEGELNSLRNAYKSLSGLNSGLSDTGWLRHKMMEERMTLIRSRRNPVFRRDFDSIHQIDRALTLDREIFLPYRFLEMSYGFRGRLARFARMLVRVTAEKQKPDGERWREYTDSQLPAIEQELFTAIPISKDLETAELADSLEEMQEALGAANPAVVAALHGKNPEEIAGRAVAETRVDGAGFRQNLYRGGAAAVAASTDPMIVLMREIDPEARAVRKRYDDEVEAVIRSQQALLIKNHAQQRGYDFSPDATFTLRLSYGRIKSYAEDGRGYLPKGSSAPAFTTLGGAFQHAAQHNDQPPYRLPESWRRRKSKLDLKTPLNFVSTVDISAGSSGSPVVNQAGEIVGIVFDVNFQALPWRFQYDDATGRAISVDSRAIVEALRKIYQAENLVKEIMGQ